jgi:CheY-like chemotaxis protein
LAFARKQTLLIKSVSLNQIITNFQKMLKRTIRENIKIKLNLMANPDIIAADTGQMEQIMVNLAINSQDAMLEGGILIIKTSLIELDAKNFPGEDIVEGNYILWQISDTGAGMDKETIKMIFEPFFTTKELGKGTGLGLSTVYGIIRQHKGYITVDSQLGKGTTFNIYMPQKDLVEKITDNLIEEEKAKTTATRETILLAEDNSTTRKIISLMLKKMRYSVLQAEDGKKALDIAMTYQGKIDLVITDVIMPEMDGVMFIDKLKLVYPDIGVIFMSGYAPDVILRIKLIEGNVNFIQKPFTTKDLQKIVQAVLHIK